MATSRYRQMLTAIRWSARLCRNVHCRQRPARRRRGQRRGRGVKMGPPRRPRGYMGYYCLPSTSRWADAHAFGSPSDFSGGLRFVPRRTNTKIGLIHLPGDTALWPVRGGDISHAGEYKASRVQTGLCDIELLHHVPEHTSSLDGTSSGGCEGLSQPWLRLVPLHQGRLLRTRCVGRCGRDCHS